jgi:hypothetical protein
MNRQGREEIARRSRRSLRECFRLFTPFGFWKISDEAFYAILHYSYIPIKQEAKPEIAKLEVG